MTVFGRRAEAPAMRAVARPRTPTPAGMEGVEDMAATLRSRGPDVGPTCPRIPDARTRPRRGAIPRLARRRRVASPDERSDDGHAGRALRGHGPRRGGAQALLRRAVRVADRLEQPDELRDHRP